jgi:hypothetical protein
MPASFDLNLAPARVEASDGSNHTKEEVMPPRSAGSWKEVILLSTIALTLCGMAMLGGGCASTSSLTSALPGALGAAEPLIGSLTTAVPGLSSGQAVMGAGSLLGLAKGKMSADDFSKVADAIPGTDALLEEAVKRGLPNGLTGISDVSKFLEKSGISSSQASQLGSALSGQLEGKVPDDVHGAFTAALR